MNLGRVEQLADDDGRVALAELEDLLGPLGVVAANEVEDLADLVRGDTHVPGDGPG